MYLKLYQMYFNAFEKARNDRAWRKMAEYEIDKVKNPQKYEK